MNQPGLSLVIQWQNYKDMSFKEWLIGKSEPKLEDMSKEELETLKREIETIKKFIKLPKPKYKPCQSVYYSHYRYGYLTETEVKILDVVFNWSNGRYDYKIYLFGELKNIQERWLHLEKPKPCK